MSVSLRKAGAKCLVHCKMGVSRSASTVIAYAMKEYGWDLDKAFNFVKQKRAVTKPNPSFMKQLEEYQGILLARCDFVSSQQYTIHVFSIMVLMLFSPFASIANKGIINYGAHTLIVTYQIVQSQCVNPPLNLWLAPALKATTTTLPLLPYITSWAWLCCKHSLLNLKTLPDHSTDTPPSHTKTPTVCVTHQVRRGSHRWVNTIRYLILSPDLKQPR